MVEKFGEAVSFDDDGKVMTQSKSHCALCLSWQLRGRQKVDQRPT